MVNKKNAVPPHLEEGHICYICSREIVGEHMYIKTKRRNGLHIHLGCMPGGNEEKWRILNKQD